MRKKLALPEGLSTQTREEVLTVQLALREKSRTAYWKEFDPFIDVRLGWRASTMRHLFHILPGQRILEIGAGDGRFHNANIHIKCLKNFPGDLRGEKFDYVVAHSH